MNTYDHSIQANGHGGEKKAYERLLLALAASDMKLRRIRIMSAGVFLRTTLIDCTLQGTSVQYATFKRRLGT